MKVLVVEPLKPCYVREIEGLQAMQEIVGGHIEAIYPYEEQVAVIANEEGSCLACLITAPFWTNTASRMTSSAGLFSWLAWGVRPSPR